MPCAGKTPRDRSPLLLFPLSHLLLRPQRHLRQLTSSLHINLLPSLQLLRPQRHLRLPTSSLLLNLLPSQQLRLLLFCLKRPRRLHQLPSLPAPSVVIIRDDDRRRRGVPGPIWAILGAMLVIIVCCGLVLFGLVDVPRGVISNLPALS